MLLLMREKKENWNQQVNLDYIKSRKDASEIVVELVCVEEVKMDEMWSYVHDKGHQCWLWHE